METTTSLAKIESNRRNALKSTGPRTVAGRAASRLNATKHGIFSKDVLVRGPSFKENGSAFAALHRRFREDLQPVGVTEEMLVDRIVTAHWRLKRAMRAESAAIALDVDSDKKVRERLNSPLALNGRWRTRNDPFEAMQETSFGCGLTVAWLEQVLVGVMEGGELTEGTVKQFEAKFDGIPNYLIIDIKQLRTKWSTNSQGLPPAEFADKEKMRRAHT